VSTLADDQLDRLLEEWAGRSRLTDAQSAAVLAAVVRAPQPGLDATWFHDLAGTVSGMIVQVATMPEAARAALLPAVPQLVRTRG
jgi:hypothetical protein